MKLGHFATLEARKAQQVKEATLWQVTAYFRPEYVYDSGLPPARALLADIWLVAQNAGQVCRSTAGAGANLQ